MSSNSSTNTSTNSNFFGSIQVLKEHADSHRAMEVLMRVARQVEPIMQKRQWKVAKLREFMPKSRNLLGLNVNRGQEICIRLRPEPDRNSTRIYDFQFVLGTMLHELVHIKISAHSHEFYTMLEELNAEADDLIRKGVTSSRGPEHKLGGQKLDREQIRNIWLKRANRVQVIPLVLWIFF